MSLTTRRSTRAAAARATERIVTLAPTAATTTSGSETESGPPSSSTDDSTPEPQPDVKEEAQELLKKSLPGRPPANARPRRAAASSTIGSESFITKQTKLPIVYNDADLSLTESGPGSSGSETEDELASVGSAPRPVATKVDKISARPIKRARKLTSRPATATASKGGDDGSTTSEWELDADTDSEVEVVSMSSTAAVTIATPAADSDVSTDDGEDVAPKPEKKRAPAARKGEPDFTTEELEQMRTMTTREKWHFKANKKTILHHPELEYVWETMPDYGPPPEMEQPESLKLKLLPYQVEGLGWLVRQEEKLGGGLLADEMGMGKTISMIALMLARRVQPTLIVAPVVAMVQWSNEIAAHVKPEDGFNILIYHGAKRIKDEAELAAYDIVITSYSVIESGFRKQEYGFKRKAGLVKEASVVHSVNWGRVVLDESHYIKDRSTNTARAVFGLNTDYRWCLSGTPIQNRVGEMYSVIRFLQLDNFAHYFCGSCSCKSLSWKFTDRKNCDQCGHTGQQHFCFWNREVLKPIQEYGSQGLGLIAFKKLLKLLGMIMLRRTKLERADDLGLPPRHVSIRRDMFSPDERDFYSSLYSESKRQFSTYVAEGTVLNHYANIFQLLTRMRQAADHPCMITSKLETSATGVAICGLCHEPAEDPVAARCKHVFCRLDVQNYLETYGSSGDIKCPVCFSRLVVDLDASAVEVTTAEVAKKAASSSIVSKIDMEHWRSSTKIEALVEELTRLQRQDHTIKSIVFSQFTQFLELIAWRLRRAGFVLVKLDGRMGIDQRDAAVRAFMTNPHVTVFLVSLKAGGIALNLTQASQVFLMDPWWNGAVQDQAIDRIHRLGQYRPIRITHIIIQDSIEERIIQLQEKKRALFESTVGRDPAALARLSEDDLKFLFLM